MRGLWSFPGGHIEAGERAREAACREVLEETGITAEICGLVDVHDVIIRADNDVLSAHYVIAVHYGRHVAGEPLAASDAAAATFVPVADVGRFTLTPGGESLIQRAAAMLREQRGLAANSHLSWR